MRRVRSKDDPEINRAIGLRIRQLRRTNGVSLETLAQKLGLTCQQVAKYEHGATPVSPAQLVTLSRLFDVHVGHFFQQPSALKKQTMPDAALMRIMRRLLLLQREKPEAIEKVRGLVRDLYYEIPGMGPIPRPHRRKKPEQGAKTAAKQPRRST